MRRIFKSGFIFIPVIMILCLVAIVFCTHYLFRREVICDHYEPCHNPNHHHCVSIIDHQGLISNEEMEDWTATLPRTCWFNGKSVSPLNPFLIFKWWSTYICVFVFGCILHSYFVTYCPVPFDSSHENTQPKLNCILKIIWILFISFVLVYIVLFPISSLLQSRNRQVTCTTYAVDTHGSASMIVFFDSPSLYSIPLSSPSSSSSSFSNSLVPHHVAFIEDFSQTKTDLPAECFLQPNQKISFNHLNALVSQTSQFVFVSLSLFVVLTLIFDCIENYTVSHLRMGFYWIMFNINIHSCFRDRMYQFRFVPTVIPNQDRESQRSGIQV